MAAIFDGSAFRDSMFCGITGYDRMKIEKIADETLDFMQDRVKKI